VPGPRGVNKFLCRYRAFSTACLRQRWEDTQRVVDGVRGLGSPLRQDLERLGAAQEESVRAFFERLGSFESAWAAEFQGEFARLFRGLSSVRDSTGPQKGTVAPRYNVFSLLGIEREEDTTHTPILANLFDPRGTHEQGFLFLREFLRCCSKDPHFKGPPKDEDYEQVVWIVDTQRFTRFGTKFGTVDIVISAPAIGYLIAVENKVYAVEQADQIGRYVRWLRARGPAYTRHDLVFLTPDGRNAKSASNVRYVRMSYRPDVVAILDSALVKIRADRVREVIAQYIETIQALF